LTCYPSQDDGSDLAFLEDRYRTVLIEKLEKKHAEVPRWDGMAKPSADQINGSEAEFSSGVAYAAGSGKGYGTPRDPARFKAPGNRWHVLFESAVRSP
jgi:hypothetical protein